MDGVQGGLGSLMYLKEQHPHLQVVLSIGGGASAAVFPVVAGNTLTRDNFARSAKGLVDASGLDGIDGKKGSEAHREISIRGCHSADTSRMQWSGSIPRTRSRVTTY